MARLMMSPDRRRDIVQWCQGCPRPWHYHIMHWPSVHISVTMWPTQPAQVFPDLDIWTFNMCLSISKTCLLLDTSISGSWNKNVTNIMSMSGLAWEIEIKCIICYLHGQIIKLIHTRMCTKRRLTTEKSCKKFSFASNYF